MISIIICSRKSEISQELLRNITETVGFDHELIVVDNSENKYSIFEAYNLGIERSGGDYLCFIHDDIFMLTNNWGKVIEDFFLINPQVGLLGIAGGKIKLKMPSAWWDAGENVLKLVQHSKNKPKEFWEHGFNGLDFVEVAAIDGVFMVMRSDKRIRFDERLKGFHNYDLNLSIKHYIHSKKIVVTNKIFLEHFSEGSLDRSWFESSSQFHKLYKSHLPIDINGNYKDKKFKKKEYIIGANFVTNLIEQKLYGNAIYWWFEVFKLKPITKYHYRFWKNILKNYLD